MAPPRSPFYHTQCSEIMCLTLYPLNINNNCIVFEWYMVGKMRRLCMHTMWLFVMPWFNESACVDEFSQTMSLTFKFHGKCQWSFLRKSRRSLGQKDITHIDIPPCLTMWIDGFVKFWMCRDVGRASHGDWETFNGFDLCGHGGESDTMHLTTTLKASCF